MKLISFQLYYCSVSNTNLLILVLIPNVRFDIFTAMEIPVMVFSIHLQGEDGGSKVLQQLLFHHITTLVTTQKTMF